MKTEEINKIPHGRYIAPCGADFEGAGRGSNRTPPKKKQKKRK